MTGKNYLVTAESWMMRSRSGRSTCRGNCLDPSLRASASVTLRTNTPLDTKTPILLLRLNSALVLCAFVVICACVSATAQANVPRTSGTLSFRPADPQNAIAFDHFYNLD